MPSSNIETATHFEGEDETLQKMVPWVQTQAQSLENETLETFFQLFYMKGAAQAPLEMHMYEQGEDFGEFCQNIWNEACEDADRRKGKSKYLLRPCKPHPSKKDEFIPLPKGRFPFVVTVVSEFDADADFTEADIEEATPKGIVAQNQRHTEKAYAQLSGGFLMVKDVYKDVISEQKDMITELRKENSDLKKDWEEAKSLNLEREMKYKEFEKDQERKDKRTEMMISLVPILLQHFLTSTAGGVTAEATAKFASFASKLTQEQKQAMVYALPPDMANQFAEAAQAAAAGAQGGGSPIASLMGALSGGL